MPKNKRKNQAPIAEFWEEKLSLNYKAEIEYYRKLCGLKYNIKLLRKNPKYDIKSQYISYQKWKEHILNGVSNLNLIELETYSLFLNQEYRNNIVRFSMHQSALVPYIVSILSIIASAIISVFSGTDDSSVVIKIACLVFIVIFYHMYINIFEGLVISGREEDTTKNFYKDIKDIVNERIDQIKECSS